MKRSYETNGDARTHPGCRRAALRRARLRRRFPPGLPPEELFWRIHFSIGAMASVLTGAPFLKIASGGRLDTSDVDGVVQRLVAYISGGLRAPLASGRRRRRGPPGGSGAS